MACVYENKKSKEKTTYVVQVTLRRKMERFYGFTNRRVAEQFGEKLDLLIAMVEAGCENPESTRWVKRLADTDSPHYPKLEKHGLVPQRVAPGMVGEMIKLFNRTNADKKERTIINRGLASRMISKFFGEDRRVATIKPSDADVLWEYMVNHYSPGTYMRKIKTVKQIFRIAVREKWITDNPFAHLKGGNVFDKSRQQYVTLKESAKIMEACPNAYWRLIFALARYGGLRIPSELIHLKWSDIFWDEGKIRIFVEKKTGKNMTLVEREIPLFKELVLPLEEYFESQPEGGPDHLFPDLTNGVNLRRGLERIISKAGVKQWPKMFVNLRASRETDLLRQHPQHLVCKWIGNSEPVMLKHYALETDTDCKDASYLGAAAAKGAEGGVLVGRRSYQGVEYIPEFSVE